MTIRPVGTIEPIGLSETNTIGYYARLWKPYLLEFMATLGPEQTGAAAVHEARGLSSRHPFL